MRTQLWSPSHSWLFEKSYWGDAAPSAEEGTLRHLRAWSEHPHACLGLQWVLALPPQTTWLCCVSVLLAPHATGCPGNHRLSRSHVLIYLKVIYLIFFKILKNYRGVAVRYHCGAVFDPERFVEHYIIHFPNHLARLLPSETEAIIGQQL